MPERTTRYWGDSWDRILQNDLDQIFPVDIAEKRKPRSDPIGSNRALAAKASTIKSKPRAA